MNIYKIMFSHHGPKDKEKGVKALFLAENEEQVYEWIASNPILPDFFIHTDWKEKEEQFYNENGEPENFKDRMLKLKGEMNDNHFDFSDAFYGITLFGWETLKENISADYSELIESGFVFVSPEIKV